MCVCGRMFSRAWIFKFIFFVIFFTYYFSSHPRIDCMYKISKWVLFRWFWSCVMVTFNILHFLIVNLVFFFCLICCDKMWMFLFCFIYVKIKFTFSYSYHSSNLGHVRKYTHKRFYSVLYVTFYFTILHQVATIFVVSFFCFLQFGRNFPLFPCVIFCFLFLRREDVCFFFVKIVLKSSVLVSFFVYFSLWKERNSSVCFVVL